MATRTPCPAAIAGRAIGALPGLIRTAPAAPGRRPEKERPAGWRRSEARAYFARREREPKRRNVLRRAAAALPLSKYILARQFDGILRRGVEGRARRRARYLRRSRQSLLS